jgi:hypothetical protein
MISNNIILALNITIFIWLGILSYIYWSYLRDKKKINKQIKDKGLDNFLKEIFEKNNQIERDIYKLYKASQEINKIATKSISRKAVIRYNPFGDTGGDQSFSVALLDLKDNGLVISSLHSRSGTRTYAKPVISGQSSHHLTEEENKVIKNAQQN